MTSTETDMFEDPAQGREAQFDQWGRYLLPDPETGKVVPWTRVTTIAETLGDRYHLEQWGKRKVLEGVVIQRGIVSQAAGVFAEHGFDPQTQEAKKALNKLVKQAESTAGTGKGADTGTALHLITEHHNQGRSGDALTRAKELGLVANLDIYIATLQREGVTVVPEMMERIVCIPEFRAVGRLDNLTREAGADLLRVFDLKTQKTMDFGSMKMAIQLAMYANASAMFDEETRTWSPMPAVDRIVATVCHLPVLEGEENKVCVLHDVDLEWGWRWARASFLTRKARYARPVTVRRPKKAPVLEMLAAARAEVTSAKAEDRDKVPTIASAVVSSGPVVLERTPQGLDWEARLTHAGTRADLLRIGEECKAAGRMTDQLKAVGKKRMAELSA